MKSSFHKDPGGTSSFLDLYVNEQLQAEPGPNPAGRLGCLEAPLFAFSLVCHLVVSATTSPDELRLTPLLGATTTSLPER